MTEEDIAAMRQDVEEQARILSGTYTIPADGMKKLMAEYGERCVEQVPVLLAEVERLRAIDKQQSEWIEQLMEEQTRYASKNAVLTTENAAMREIVQAVVTMDAMLENGNGWIECVFLCGAGELGQPDHTPDCPVTKARAILEK